MREIVLDTETTGFEPADGHRIVEIGCVDHRFEIADPSIQGQFGDIPIGQTVTARIIADQLVAFREA